MFHRTLKQKMSQWFDYIDVRLKKMDDKISNLEKAISEKSLDENIVETKQKRD